MISSFHSLIWGVGTFLIFLLTSSRLAWSLSCTNNWPPWFIQSVWVLHQFSLLVHGRKIFVSAKVVLTGKSSYTPPIVMSSLLSMRIDLLIGSEFPKSAFANETEIIIVEGSFNTWRLPPSIWSVNISGKSCSTHMPLVVNFLSAVATTWPFFHEVSDTALKSPA